MDTILIFVLVSLLLSFFFSGIEIAYVSANKLKVELLREQQVMTGRLLGYFIKRPSHFLTATLVGNNIALVIYGIYMALLLETLFIQTGVEFLQQPVVTFLLQTILSSLVVMVVAEFLPKALFRINPNKLLQFFALPMMLVYWGLFPVIIFIVWLSKTFIQQVFRIRLVEQSPVFSRVDLFHFIEESAGSEEEADMEVDKQIFQNAIEFAHVKVRECMVPRTELVAVDITSTVDEVIELFQETGHSKLLVYKENIDNIIGYVHIVDLFRKPDKVEEVLLPILIATEAMPANELLRQLIEKRRSLAVVVDEFGGTAGIVTIEDIIEEIFGEIEDEHDKEDLREEQINDYEYIFSARLEVDYLNETYHLKLPEGDYETLGGLILDVHQSIPKEREEIKLHPYCFEVMGVDGARIKDVRLIIMQDEG